MCMQVHVYVCMCVCVWVDVVHCVCSCVLTVVIFITSVEKWPNNQLEVDRKSLPNGIQYNHPRCPALPQVNQGSCLVNIVHQNESESGYPSKSWAICFM